MCFDGRNNEYGRDDKHDVNADRTGRCENAVSTGNAKNVIRRRVQRTTIILQRQRSAAAAAVSPAVKRATATGGWWSPRDRPPRTRRSTGSPRTRRRRISATVCRTSSSCAGSTIDDAVWRTSAAGDRPASGTARDRCDRAARLKTRPINNITRV